MFGLKASLDLISELVKETFMQATLVLDAIDECESSSRLDPFGLLAKLARM